MRVLALVTVVTLALTAVLPGPLRAEYQLSPQEARLLCINPEPRPYIVVVGSVPEEVDQVAWGESMVRRIEACGDWWWVLDITRKYEGLRPGFYFAYVGVFEGRAAAEAARRQLASCFPDAYLRQTCWYGE